MREIKCRGRAENGEWYEGYYVAGWMYDINRIAQPYPFLLGSQKDGEVRVEAETVGQYTGMKDINGVEVCEGDIVKYKQRNLSQAFGDKDAPAFTEEKRVIRFHNYSFNVPQGFVKEIEVIGNIYDNPELIK